MDCLHCCLVLHLTSYLRRSIFYSPSFHLTHSLFIPLAKLFQYFQSTHLLLRSYLIICLHGFVPLISYTFYDNRNYPLQRIKFTLEFIYKSERHAIFVYDNSSTINVFMYLKSVMTFYSTLDSERLLIVFYTLHLEHN